MTKEPNTDMSFNENLSNLPARMVPAALRSLVLFNCPSHVVLSICIRVNTCKHWCTGVHSLLVALYYLTLRSNGPQYYILCMKRLVDGFHAQAYNKA